MFGWKYCMVIKISCENLLEYESGVVHIDKIQGLECVYKACELLLLLPIGFGMEPHLSLYAWLICLMPNWYIKFNMVSERGVRSWFATVSIWLKIVCTCRALLIAHTWGGVLEYESGVCPTLIKFKGLSVYIKFVSYPLLWPIGFGMEPHLSLYAWLV